MRKYLFLVLSAIALNASNFKLGLNTANYQDSEGGGIALFYKINDTILFETSYNEYYIRGVKNNEIAQSWNKFNTQRFGIRYYLKSYANNEIKLFTSVGLEHIGKNSNLSTNDTKLNSYGLLGLDFMINKNFNISFAFGSSGKGEKANQLKTSPNYAHGFNSIIGIEYTF
jgi:hypothetical protein